MCRRLVIGPVLGIGSHVFKSHRSEFKKVEFLAQWQSSGLLI